MHTRYTNASLWRGDGSPTSLTSFDVVDGIVSEPLNNLPLDHVVDLGGKFIMPAFRDGHCHPLFAGREHLGPDVTHAETLAELQDIVRKYAVSHPTVLWIDGAAYDRSIEAKFHRSELDAAVSDRPIILHGSDHHTLWLNTKALELCGFMDAVPELSVGTIDVDSDGVPTGILREWQAMKLAMDHLPILTMDQELDSLDWAQQHLIQLGVAEVQDAWIDPGMTEIYLAALERNRLRLKVALAFRADPITWKADFDYFVNKRTEVQKTGDERLSANAIKFFVDGVLGSSTASVIEPYVAGPSIHQHGEQVWDHSELQDAAKRANELGFQLHLHAIGDLAVRTALDIIEAVQPSIQPVIAHTEMVSDDDLTRFAALDVTANFEPLWAREDGQLLTCLPQLGRERLDGMYRMRDLIEAGSRLSFGSDWPVSSPDPLLGLATAVNRSLPGGPSWVKEQALSVAEALTAYTSGAAKQISNSTRDGSLRPGAPAEFVVLSANPFEVEESVLFGISVIGINLPKEPLLGL